MGRHCHNLCQGDRIEVNFYGHTQGKGIFFGVTTIEGQEFLVWSKGYDQDRTIYSNLRGVQFDKLYNC
ncbi:MULTISPECIES: hypothetical protein [Bacillus cereus group]|uniref:Uncharacterized protein n=2 Tax=Bacillus cereus group TaxID=86661 RepID=A0A9X7FYQ5_BACTU|nr:MULTISPECIES: hypothetical protein [Bacillus cereus group]MCQ6289074.1 hypothetical protein [Bacillus cereus]MCQ6307453.1 hypothetical protein [Bacillus cereus]MCQ6318546.1 hypothetical protein [Bacillus cereus]MCQ6330879.1 hypothetical protein [Bacillus cereus]MCQ6386109.1 hypothetical protein [Bacillus cereus]